MHLCVTCVFLCNNPILRGLPLFLSYISHFLFSFIFLFWCVVASLLLETVLCSQIDIHWSVPPSCHFVSTITVWSSAKRDIWQTGKWEWWTSATLHPLTALSAPSGEVQCTYMLKQNKKTKGKEKRKYFCYQNFLFTHCQLTVFVKARREQKVRKTRIDQRDTISNGGNSQKEKAKRRPDKAIDWKVARALFLKKSLEKYCFRLKKKYHCATESLDLLFVSTLMIYNPIKKKKIHYFFSFTCLCQVTINSKFQHDDWTVYAWECFIQWPVPIFWLL